jgi:hypothetical protein
MWQRLWLYVRLGLLGLIALLAVQMFIANVAREGTEKPAVTFFVTETFGGVWSLIVAFVLGLFATPLYKASLKTWKEFRAEQARKRDEQADTALKKSLAETRDLVQAGRPSQSEPDSKPVGPAVRKDDPAPGAKSEEKTSAADIWTSGEEDT